MIRFQTLTRLHHSLLVCVGVIAFTGTASARYQRVSALAAVPIVEQSCLVIDADHVYRPDNVCIGDGYSAVQFPIPTEFRGGSSQSYSAWIVPSDEDSGVDLATSFAFYKDGTYAGYSNFNSGNRLSAGTEYSTSVTVPMDGFFVVGARLEDGDGVSSCAWEFMY